jgi:hypothetical protein
VLHLPAAAVFLVHALRTSRMILQYIQKLNAHRIVLASQSRRRKEALENIGLVFEVWQLPGAMCPCRIVAVDHQVPDTRSGDSLNLLQDEGFFVTAFELCRSKRPHLRRIWTSRSFPQQIMLSPLQEKRHSTLRLKPQMPNL